ncbi:MAG: DUF4494 domain-containing protein [Salinivirgaceae bacterium]|jgi:hypothetical protein|nr:DUF4494 domain-containing protein [Salinivirgaceae bacterium]
MENWFECKVKYDRRDEFGQDTAVSESYLVDALSFTEAESRLIKLLEGEVPDEFVINGIGKAKLSEVIPADDADYWYKAKVVFIDIDEKSGKEKKSVNQVLVAADDIGGALQNLLKNFETVLVPWEIHSITLTKVVEVFPYHEDDVSQTDVDAEKTISGEDKDYIAEE